MNREQRRKMAKNNITDKELKHFQDNIAKETMNDAVNMYSVGIAMVLRDKWGFGQVRLTRFLGQAQEMFDSINEGYVSFEDCKKALYDECGVEFR